MALVRCAQHEPVGRTSDYVASVEPLGYPATALVCGSARCEEPGLVWLVQSELDEYQNGGRVFRIPSFATKIMTK